MPQLREQVGIGTVCRVAGRVAHSVRLLGEIFSGVFFLLLSASVMVCAVALIGWLARWATS